MGLLPADGKDQGRKAGRLIMSSNRETETEHELADAEPVSGQYKKRNKDHDNRSEITSYLIIVTACLVLFTCVFSTNKVPSTSMEPTIAPKSFIINWRLPYLLGNPLPKYGDIVVFKAVGQDRRFLVKRVIGLPGDRISFKDGYVYRNGQKLDEPYLMAEGETFSKVESYSVPDGSFFVLGDNRQHSRDSRYMEEPFIPIENLRAKCLFSFPINPLKWFS